MMTTHCTAVMQTYARYPLRLTRGEGSRVWDDQGRCYLDFIAGVAVNTLGHAHPVMRKAISEQAATMLHCSNLFHIPAQEALAMKLASLSGLDAVFFANSGAEANEAAIKLVRKYWHDHGQPRYKMIAATQSFHGRTMMTLTATGQDKVKQGFAPLPEGVMHVDYNDMAALQAVMDATVAGVILEPVQGEGGVVVPDAGYLQAVQALCQEHGALLILDEIQTGIGRTGAMFACEHEGMVPDVMTLAKGLGGGVPIGAMLAKADIAASFSAGSHGSTFGGNPLSCTAALTVLDVLEKEQLLVHVQQTSAYFIKGLQRLCAQDARMLEVRGKGLLLGLACSEDVAGMIGLCREKGLLLLQAGPTVLRFVPALNVTQAEIDEALVILAQALTEWS